MTQHSQSRDNRFGDGGGGGVKVSFPREQTDGQGVT